MTLADLPPEVLEAIFVYCDPSILVQVCRLFSAITYAVPALWASVNIGIEQVARMTPFTGRRSSENYTVPRALFHPHNYLQRAGTLPLNMTINLTGGGIDSDLDIDGNRLFALCAALTTYKARIRVLEIICVHSTFVGLILNRILFAKPTEVLSSLKELRLLYDYENNASKQSYLEANPSALLAIAVQLLPNLRTLHISGYRRLIPVCGKSSAPFTKLTTLILVDSERRKLGFLQTLCSFLHHTPNLQTLWFKTFLQPSYGLHENTLPPAPFLSYAVPVPVKLPRLLRLALSAPGASLDLLHYVEAPALRELYLDGTGVGGGQIWCDDDAQWLEKGLGAFAPRAQSLKRIVLDNAHIPKPCWEWLLTRGKDGLESFPKLEDICLRGLNYAKQNLNGGLDDEVLLAYAKEPRVLLRNISISHSLLSIGNMAILAVAKAIVSSLGVGGLRFSVEGSSTQWFTEELARELESFGAIVYRNVQDDDLRREWWRLGPNLDPLEGFLGIR